MKIGFLEIFKIPPAPVDLLAHIAELAFTALNPQIERPRFVTAIEQLENSIYTCIKENEESAEDTLMKMLIV